MTCKIETIIINSCWKIALNELCSILPGPAQDQYSNHWAKELTRWLFGSVVRALVLYLYDLGLMAMALGGEYFQLCFILVTAVTP